jgi:ubiquinone/menaquinone biosynthesis C-methylase UbiE
MIGFVQQKVSNEQLDNVILIHRDILTQTTGLADNSVDYVMLFNILHHDSPDDFLIEAHRILKINGKVGIIHWRSDISTPRGPDLSIRPKPEQIIHLSAGLGFVLYKEPVIIQPYHYGLIISKPENC